MSVANTVRMFAKTLHKHRVLEKYKNKLRNESWRVNYEWDEDKKEVMFKCLHQGYLIVTPCLCEFDPENEKDIKILENCLKEMKKAARNAKRYMKNLSVKELYE